MSKTRITWNIIAGVGAIGLSIFACIGAYQCYHGDICASASTDYIVYFVTGIFMVLVALWLFVLPYCPIYRLIDEIIYVEGKLKFSCGGKSFEDEGCIFLKFKLHSEESTQAPTHVFVLLKSGLWLCPYALWKDYVENAKDKRYGIK